MTETQEMLYALISYEAHTYYLPDFEQGTTCPSLQAYIVS